MREIFVTELVKEILGPRNGIYEVVTNNSPLNEYITGVLTPSGNTNSQNRENAIDDLAEIPVEDIKDAFEDDNDDADVNVPPLFSPALDPQSRPPSFGLSFMVTSMQTLTIEFCITWARYFEEEQEDNNTRRWRRNPRYVFLKIDLTEGTRRIYFDERGNESTANLGEILVYFIVRQSDVEHKKYIISIHCINNITTSPNTIPSTHDYIFQPQIRILTTPNTLLTETFTNVSENEEDEILKFLYRQHRIFARGHLCSALWSEIDPEIFPTPKPEVDSPKHLELPPFRWLDGDILPQEVRLRFSKPNIRTEFVPLYSMNMPNLKWKNELGRTPLLEADRLAELWKSDDIDEAFSPFIIAYKKWIENLENDSLSLPQNKRILSKKIVDECNTVLFRMKQGINILKTDEDVRLAFCFANKAMDIQSQWFPRKRKLIWFPFQLAFILTSLESVVNPSSSFRDVCDLLWVPTGAGKTEAYLGLIALTVSFRRKKSLKNMMNDNTGAGVSVISRYTLRLLTIQQFRRTLSLVTACEYLRVYNLSLNNASIGWRPLQCNITDNYLWGSTQFSIGLWVGNEITPNRLKTLYLRDDRGAPRPIYGALEILTGSARQHTGEPAQVLNCPACGTILAIPEMGLQAGLHSIYFVIESVNNEMLLQLVPQIRQIRYESISIEGARVFTSSANFYTLEISVHSSDNITSSRIDGLWENIDSFLSTNGCSVTLMPARASRPGYFLRHYINENRRPENYDFEIFCPNPQVEDQSKCFLKEEWASGLPMGSIHGIAPDQDINQDSSNLERLPDGNLFTYSQTPFRRNTNPFLSDRIPIPAITVDEQIYHRLPTVIVATVDKFARFPFEPQAASIIGNVTLHHNIHGFYRAFHHSSNDTDEHPTPSGRGRNRYYQQIRQIGPPDLILQDELHLIDGPLGSLSGLYEVALDNLCHRNHPIKYISSTATIKRAKEQVQSLFLRKLQIFPPPGSSIDDRFFITENVTSLFNDSNPGRLYVGVCAPGRGPLTPIVRIWARILQTAFEYRTNEKIDPFWTLTGYFNAVRELAGAKALYRQDIPQRIDTISMHSPARRLNDENAVELSSRARSTDLPSILDILSNRTHRDPNAADALFTTSMFGTGVDISRIGLMVVNGQPKTTSSYIQSTGRVGRNSGGIVITFYRASRPRDLSHYEFFCSYHHQLHRFVEPITVYPFAPGVLERALGPVAVYLLRNMRNVTLPWDRDISAIEMAHHRTTATEITSIPSIFERRASNQPEYRRPLPTSTSRKQEINFDIWQSFANRLSRLRRELRYVEYAISRPPTTAVVLGDSQHRYAGLDVIYNNVPQSLREIEETTGFQT